MTLTRAVLCCLALGAVACANNRGASVPCEPNGDCQGSSGVKAALATLLLPQDARPPLDPTNAFADDPRAAALGQRFFFDTRFSGPLLDAANDGTSGTLGPQGMPGKVACASCHQPTKGAFADHRSPRGQLSLGSGWTHRKAPSLLDVAQLRLLMWDGRRDSAFSQIFSPLESPLELNSSRLFLAQQIARYYKSDYETVFGPLPKELDDFEPLAPEQAGCETLPEDPVSEQCRKPGHETEAVIRVAVNFGKAIAAYTRKLSCGRSRFDEWLEGDESAMTAEEQAGAALFVDKGACIGCHSGPYLTDGRFHNLGIGGEIVPFTGVSTLDDPGAAVGVEQLLKDPLNSKGMFSDGYDGRLESLPADTSTLLGAFHTPGLRCVSRRPSFMHNGKYRSLEDMVDSFSFGASKSGYVGEAETFPRSFSNEERQQLIAFLNALDGSGPDEALMVAPAPASSD